MSQTPNMSVKLSNENSETKIKIPMITVLVLIVLSIGVVLAYSSFFGKKDAVMEDEVIEQTTAEGKAESETMMADDNGTVDAMKEESMMAEETTENDSMMAETADYTVDTFMYGYSPNVLEVPAGGSITVKLTNSDGFHDLVVDELNVASKRIKEGEETMVTITAPASAKDDSYEFYCSVGDHRAKGMVGTIRVI